MMPVHRYRAEIPVRLTNQPTVAELDKSERDRRQIPRKGSISDFEQRYAATVASIRDLTRPRRAPISATGSRITASTGKQARPIASARARVQIFESVRDAIEDETDDSDISSEADDEADVNDEDVRKPLQESDKVTESQGVPAVSSAGPMAESSVNNVPAIQNEYSSSEHTGSENQPVEPRRSSRLSAASSISSDSDLVQSKEKSGHVPVITVATPDITRCVCGEIEEDPGDFLIQCETCKVWQHGLCMGYESKDQVHDDEYYCEQCRPELHIGLLQKLAKRLRHSPSSHAPLDESIKEATTVEAREAMSAEAMTAQGTLDSDANDDAGQEDRIEMAVPAEAVDTDVGANVSPFYFILSAILLPFFF